MPRAGCPILLLLCLAATLTVACSDDNSAGPHDAGSSADTLHSICYEGCIKAGKSHDDCVNGCTKTGTGKDGGTGGKTDPCVDACVKGGQSTAYCKNYCLDGVYRKAHGEACLPQKQGSYYRCWNKYVPKSSAGGKPPLIIDLHGWGATPEFIRTLSRWPALADKEGFVVVWPYGVGKSWNAGKTCCDPASKNAIDDVAFLRALIKELVKSNGVDPTRIYLSGHSNGCAMAQRFAAEASDLTAAVACMALYLLVDAAAKYTPVSVMEFHGTSDPTVSYQPGQHVGAVANFQKWATMNSCSGSPVETWRQGQSFVQTYKNCKDGTEVSLMTMDKGGHYPYGGKGSTIESPEMAWEFMRRFTRKP